MLRVVYLVLALLAAVCVAEEFEAAPLPGGRIAGGSDTSIYDFPYQISLRYNNEHKCGGSIYSESIVLTAAHCVHYYPPEVFTVVAGSTFLSEPNIPIPVKKIITHPSFRTSTSNYDVSILVLEDLLRFRPGVQPIALANEHPPAGTIATFTGWGYRDGSSGFSNQLQKLDLSVISRADCRKSYTVLSVTSQMLCTAVVDGNKACHGDLGSPLVVNNQLLGLQSWGGYCGMDDKPTVYASVPDLYKWIVKTIEENHFLRKPRPDPRQ